MFSRAVNLCPPPIPTRCVQLGRAFSAHRVLQEKPLPPRVVIPETDLQESFLKGTGPGGQKINKTSSAVQLKHLPTGIVVKNQATRSREQNRRNARRILGEKLEEMEKGPLSRTALKAEKEKRQKASASKKARRKYRKLDKEDAHAGNKKEVRGVSDGTDAGVPSASGSVADDADEHEHSPGERKGELRQGAAAACVYRDCRQVRT